MNNFNCCYMIIVFTKGQDAYWPTMLNKGDSISSAWMENNMYDHCIVFDIIGNYLYILYTGLVKDLTSRKFIEEWGD